MAISASIPTLWAAQMLEQMNKRLVYVPAFTNQRYGGEVKNAGDTVKIMSIVRGNQPSTYSGTVTYDALSDTSKTLTIDQKKFYAFEVDDIDDQFSLIQLASAYGQEYGYQAADFFDQHIASLYTSVDAANLYGTTGTPIVVGTGVGEQSAYNVFTILNQKLDEANAQNGDRRIVVPPWFYRQIKLELAPRATSLGDTVTSSGNMMMLDGVQVLTSNNVPNTAGAKFRLLMGTPVITHVRVIQKVESIRMETSFKDGIRALFVYGSLMYQPKEMACATVSKGTGVI